MQIAEPAKMVDERKDSMVSFGLWIETRARLAGRGPALPQKGDATAGNARTDAARTPAARMLRVARRLHVPVRSVRVRGINKDGTA